MQRFSKALNAESFSRNMRYTVLELSLELIKLQKRPAGARAFFLPAILEARAIFLTQSLVKNR